MDKLKAWLQRARAAVAARLVDDWRHLHRFYSVKIAALSVLLVEAWPYIPKSILDALPSWFSQALAAAVFVAIMIGVGTKQDFSRRSPPDGGADA